MAVEKIPISYSNPKEGTKLPRRIRSRSVKDLKARKKANNQSNLYIHHVPQKAVAASEISGYQPPPSDDEPGIVLGEAEHKQVTQAQARKLEDRFDTLPPEIKDGKNLTLRDLYHLKKHTDAPKQSIQNMAGAIRGKYPFLFRALRGRR